MSVPGIAGLHAAQHWFRELGTRLAASVGEGAASGAVAGPDLDAVTEVVMARLRDGSFARVPDDHGALCRLAVEHVHAVEMGHLARIESALAGRPGVRVLTGSSGAVPVVGRDDGPEDVSVGHGERPDTGPRVATLSFTVEGLDTARVADALDADHGICARAGLQCAPLVHVDAGTAESGGTVRLSPGFFTDEEDMAQLLEALDEVLATAPPALERREERVS